MKGRLGENRRAEKEKKKGSVERWRRCGRSTDGQRRSKNHGESVGTTSSLPAQASYVTLY